MSAAPGPSREGVGTMFDRIAPRYDFLNRVLSMRMDIGWRRAVRRNLPDIDNMRVLDVATGTADLLLELSLDPKVGELIGVDISKEMLEVGRTKLSRLPEGTTADLHLGDALDPILHDPLDTGLEGLCRRRAGDAGPHQFDGDDTGRLVGELEPQEIMEEMGRVEQLVDGFEREVFL